MKKIILIFALALQAICNAQMVSKKPITIWDGGSGIFSSRPSVITLARDADRD